MRKPLYYLALAVIVLTLLVPGCGGTSNAGKGPINVGSKLDLEGQLLAQMIILMLEDNGFEAVDLSSFGATNVVRAAGKKAAAMVFEAMCRNEMAFWLVSISLT